MPAKTTKLRVDLYGRLSLIVDETQDGIERQTIDLIAEAKRHDEWSVEHAPFADESISASGDKVRPDFQIVLDRLAANLTDAVLVNDLDRFTRCPRELELMIDLAEKKGKRFFTLKQGEIDLSTPGGRAMARVMVTMARFELDQMSDRQKSKVRHAATEGGAHGKPPFGYRVGETSRSRVKDEAVADVVDKIFAKLLADEPLYAIARWLNDEHPKSTKTRKHTTRKGRKGDSYGGRWTVNSLHRIALSPSYAGVLVHRSKEATGDGLQLVEQSRYVDAWPAYISFTEHLKIVAMFAARKTGTRSREDQRRHLLSGVARCAKCGSLMFGNARPQGDFYRCQRACMGVDLPRTDDKVKTFLIRRIAEEWATIEAPKASTSKLDVEIAKLTDRLARMREKLDEIDDDDERDEERGSIARLKAKLSKLEASRPARRPVPSTVAAIAAEPTFDAMLKRFESIEDVGQRAAIVRALLDVTILPAARKGERFDSDRVVVEKKKLAA